MPAYKRMLMRMKNETAGAGHTVAAAEKIKNANEVKEKKKTNKLASVMEIQKIKLSE